MLICMTELAGQGGDLCRSAVCPTLFLLKLERIRKTETACVLQFSSAIHHHSIGAVSLLLDLVGCPCAVQNEKRLEPPEPQEPVELPVVPPVERKPVVTTAPKEDRGLDPEALRKEDREIEDTGRRKGTAAQLHQKSSTSARPAVDAEVKKQEQLLESIAMEQRAQKKMLEELQRELKQELAKHKEESQGNNTAPKLETKVPEKPQGISQDKPDKPVDGESVKKPTEPLVQKKVNKQTLNVPSNLDRADSGPVQLARKDEHSKAEMDGHIQAGAGVRGQQQGNLPEQLRKGSPVGLQMNVLSQKQSGVLAHEPVTKQVPRSGQNVVQHEAQQPVQSNTVRSDQKVALPPVQQVIQDAAPAGVQLLIQRANKMSVQSHKNTQETGPNQRLLNEIGSQNKRDQPVSAEAAKPVEIQKNPSPAVKELPQLQVAAKPAPAQQVQNPKDQRPLQVASRNEPLAVQMSKVVKREVSGDAADAVPALPAAKDIAALEKGNKELSQVAEGATGVASGYQSIGHGEVVLPANPDTKTSSGLQSLRAEARPQAKHEIRR